MLEVAADEALDVTVIVCTRNRAGPLSQLLQSMQKMRVPDGLHWELIVVDNGSSDTTRDVVYSFSRYLPVRYEYEERSGLSNARNRGVSVARGQYICWTDDDALVDPNWLSGYVAAFRDHPEAAVFGGPIFPQLDGPTPAWFARLTNRWPISDIVARRDFGDAPQLLDFERNIVPWGVNFAVRMAEQRTRLYDPELGVSPAHRRSSEESQLMFEILSSGATGWWVPSSKVHHIFPAHRQSRRYVFEHFAAIGEARAYLDDRYGVHVMNRDGHQPRLVHRSTAYLASTAFLNAALFIGFAITGLTLRSLYYLRRSGLYFGIAAYRKTRSRAPVQPVGAAKI